MANKYTYSEMFHSVQGEGRYIGKPSVFFRTFGCNFSCHGFGQDAENIIPVEEMPYMKFDVDKAKSLLDIPVCNIGCDSAGSWQERFRHLASQGEVNEVVDKLIDLTCKTEKSLYANKPHLVITGGEPLLKGLQDLHVNLINDDDIQHAFGPVTFETNGTQILNSSFNCIRNQNEINFSVSPKLSNSGEKFSEAINVEALKSYSDYLQEKNKRVIGKRDSQLWLKFVVRNEQQMDEISRALDLYADADVWWDDIYLMAEGGDLEGLKKTSEIVANLALKNGFSYSPRAHVDVFGNQWGT